MTPSAEIEPRDDALPVSAEEEQALAKRIQAKADDKDTVIPLLKIAQGQSASVQSGNAEPGEFVNALTGENFGTEITFIVADQFKGRFWSDENDNGRGAQGDIIPWPEHPDYGTRFDESEDAEEQFRAAVQAGDKEWGTGPGISTTFNFIGFVVDSEEGEGSAVPVRLSLMRTNVPAARKLQTFVTRLSRTPWESVYTLKTIRREKGRYVYHVVEVEQARAAEPAEQQAAVKLALVLEQDPVEYAEDPETAEPEKPAAPADREGALDV